MLAATATAVPSTVNATEQQLVDVSMQSIVISSYGLTNLNFRISRLITRAAVMTDKASLIGQLHHTPQIGDQPICSKSNGKAMINGIKKST
jgi:hypothetical protein